jgi:hypothetical protein
MTNHTAFAAATLLGLALTGCAGTAQASQGGSSDGAGQSAASSTASATTSATVVGRFRIVGGPYPGINRATSGHIQIRANTAKGKIVDTAAAPNGRFSASLRAGKYVFIGRANGMGTGGQGCTTGQAVTLRAGATTKITVQCDVP